MAEKVRDELPLSAEFQIGLSKPIGGAQAVRLLLALRVERLLGRAFGAGWSVAHTSAVGRGTRQANGFRWLLPLLASGVGLAALTAFGLLQGSILADQHALGAHGLLATAVAHLLVLLITVTLLSLGMSNKDVNQLDEDMEWLLALPASIPVLYSMKVGERTLSNGYAWLLIYPWVVGMISGGQWSWSTPLVAILVCLPLFLLLALYYVVLESAARRWLPKALINSLQLAGTLGGFSLALAVLTSPERMAFLAGLPWLPLTGAVRLTDAILARSVSTLRHGAFYGLEVALWFGLGALLLHGISRSGAHIGRGARSGRRGARATPLPRARGLSKWGMLDKELIRIARDTKAQQLALVVPATLLFLVGGLAVTTKGQLLFSSSQHLPALAFGLGVSVAFICLGSLLFSERDTLWLHFCFPRRLGSMLREQALPWVVIACGYAALVMAYGLTRQPVSYAVLGGAGYCLIGVALISLLSAAFAAYLIDPAATKQGDVSLSGSAQVLLLGAVALAYSYGFYGGLWQQLSLVVLLGAVTAAAWREVERRLPYLLEPELRPPPAISLLDGLVCALLFVVLQGVSLHIATHRLALEGWPAQLAAFVAAGALVSAGAWFGLRYRGVPAIHTRLGLVWSAGHTAALLQGLAFSIPAAAVALGFAVATSRLPWLSEWATTVANQRPRIEDRADGLALMVFSLLAAPLFEELIFRGLIFRALRQDLRLRTSVVLAAAIFALMHPSVAALPVFSMGVCAALAFERSGSLVSPVVVHTVYNLTLLAASRS